MSAQAIAQKPPGIKPRSTKTKVAGLLIAIVFLAIVYTLPTPDGLSQSGKMAIALLAAGIIIWILESTPQFISAMFLMVMMYYLDILPLKDIWAKFTPSAWFFVMATFVFTAALKKTTLPTRLVAYLLKISKGKPKGVVLAFVLSPFVLSCFCTNLASTAMFMGIVVGLLQSAKCIPGESRLGRCLMMAVPYGAFIGGCTLLCGSSANVMVLALAEENLGFTMNFAQWASVGIPLAIIALPVTWLSLCIGFKPEGVPLESIQKIQDQVKEMGKLNALDLKVAIVILVCIALWISNTWTGINTAVVGIIGVFLLFLPGMNVLTYKEFSSGISWNVLLLMGSIIAMSAGLTATGANAWLASLIMPLVEGAGHAGGMAISSYALILIRLLLPTASAMAGVVVVPLGTIAIGTGMSLAVITIMCAWMAGTTFLLPVDTLLLIPHSFGWSSMTETLRVGWIPALVIATYAWTIAPLIFNLWGL